MKRRYILLLLPALLLLANCTTSKNTVTADNDASTHQPLGETYWRLISLLGNKIEGRDSNTMKQPFIIFSKDGRASGNAGCNNFSGSYTKTESSLLRFGPLMSTKMYCEGVKYENLFMDVLSKTDNFLIEKDTLYLRSRSLDSTAVFIAIKK